MNVAAIQLTAEDHAEIRANAMRLFRGKVLAFRVPPAKCVHGLTPRSCYFCAKAHVTTHVALKSPEPRPRVPDRLEREIVFASRRVDLWNEEVSFVGVDASDHNNPRDFNPTIKASTHHLGALENAPDVGGGFRWNDLVFHRKPPEPQNMPRTGEAARDAANDAAPDPEPAPDLPPHFKSYDIHIIGELPRESVRDGGGNIRKSFPVRDRFTGELEFVDPQFTTFPPVRKLKKYGTYARLPFGSLPERTSGELTEDADKLRREWNKILVKHGLPEEPYACDVKSKDKGKRKVFRFRESMWDDGSAEVVFDESKRPTGDMHIFNEPAMKYENLRMLHTHFHGATPEEVSEAGEAMQWVHRVSVDPESLKNFSKTQQKAIQRRLHDMREKDEGRCHTGVCPTNQCANLEISLADRKEIHRANTAKFDSIANLGCWFFWVKLNEQWYAKFLPLPLGETRPKKVQAAFRKVVRLSVREVTRRADKTERRAAFHDISGLHFMEVVVDEDNAKTYVWDRLAGRVKVVDDATGEAHDFEGLPPKANAAD